MPTPTLSNPATHPMARRLAHTTNPRNHDLIIMQNKPNFPAPRMNLSSIKTMNYEQITMNNAHKYKPNQSQFQNQENAPAAGVCAND
jgi:hypothetical protein